MAKNAAQIAAEPLDSKKREDINFALSHSESTANRRYRVANPETIARRNSAVDEILESKWNKY